MESSAHFEGEALSEDPNYVDLNEARIEDELPDDSFYSGHSEASLTLPQEPTTLMSAADVRGAAVFCGMPLVDPEWRKPPHSWPHPGAHREIRRVVNWKALVL